MDDEGDSIARTSYSNAYPQQPRTSLDNRAARPARLQKNRSYAGMRSVSHGQPFSTAGQSITTMRGNGSTTAGGFGEGIKARKPSIRNAVRRIFGRRSRDVAPQSSTLPTIPSAPRHNYHHSEPVVLGPSREEPRSNVQSVEGIGQYASDPYQVLSSPSFNRAASPYAVQFPKSVRLKPMDLGNPFMAPPNQLKRRKTLPSMVEGEPYPQPEHEAMPSANDQIRGAASHDQQPRTPSEVRKARRKSRSTDDLKRTSGFDEGLPRKRSEEIRYWRESFQPHALPIALTTDLPVESDIVQARASTPRVHRPPRTLHTDLAVPTSPEPEMLASSALSRTVTPRSSPPFQHGHGLSVSERDFRPSSGAGTDMSKELEDRVAKLEAGLQNFQRSLQRLTADRNRRTVIMGESIRTRRSSSDMRTPSLLADTLSDPLEATTYDYGYDVRRAASPPQPTAQPYPPPQARSQLSPLPRQPEQRQGYLEDPFGPEPPLPSTVENVAESIADTFQIPASLQSHPHAQEPPMIRSGTSHGQPQPYTFNSLYQMLADERSARRKLETQLRNLRQEISDLHVQVASSSNVQSQRSSYMLAGSSSRLQELLRETESSPPSASRREEQRDSGLSAGTAPRVSRFSGSESEADAQDYEELPTPYDAYQTPVEERSKYTLTGTRGDQYDDDMGIF